MFLYWIFLEMKNTVFLSQKVDGNMIFTDYWKVLVLIFSGMRNTAFLEPKSCWKDDIYWLLKSSWFNLFGDGKHGPFLSQEVDGKIIFTDYWKVLVWSFREWEIRSFLSQKVDGKMIFTGCWEVLVLKYGLFSSKKFIERWYLLGLF